MLALHTAMPPAAPVLHKCRHPAVQSHLSGRLQHSVSASEATIVLVLLTEAATVQAADNHAKALGLNAPIPCL